MIRETGTRAHGLHVRVDGRPRVHGVSWGRWSNEMTVLRLAGAGLNDGGRNDDGRRACCRGRRSGWRVVEVEDHELGV